MSKSTKISTPKKKGKAKSLNMTKPAMEKTDIEEPKIEQKLESTTQQKDAVVDSSTQETKAKTPCSQCQLNYINDRIKTRKILIAVESLVAIGSLITYFIARKRNAQGIIITLLPLLSLALIALVIKDAMTLKDFTEKRKAIQQALLLEQITKLNQS